MDWQGVTNFEESAENYFRRILLLKSDAARREVGDEGERRRWGQETERVRQRSRVADAESVFRSGGWLDGRTSGG